MTPPISTGATRIRTGVLGSVLALALVLTGCQDDPAPAGSAPDPTPSVPVKAPPVGACYRLAVADGLELSRAVPPVPCSQRHTSVTVATGKIKKAANGSTPAVESATAQRQIARSCKAKVDAHVGGSREDRRLSRVQAVWFSPSPDQAATGARWYRCDLVVAGNQRTFAALPRTTRGLLDRTGADRFSTCGTAAPGAPLFRRVPCSAAHTWRARTSIDLPRGTPYLGAKAGRRADATCRDVEARRAVTATRLRWSFEWPTRAQWNSGQRYGLCWTPD